MSALWTPGRAGVSPRGSWWHSPALSRCGTTATAASDPASSAAPSPATRGPITRHQRHDLKHRALPGARAKTRRPWFDADPARTEPALPRSCPKSACSTRVGIY